ncbi:YoaK family protein [Mycobacterium scrofulaceum]|nr:YoaK family protein [Mycobacterium scrofulaceum]
MAVLATPIAPTAADHPHPRWPAAVAAALTFGTGALDVTTLTHLGGVFASVMTGNFALTGLALAHSDRALLTHTAVALGGYVLGVATGTRITGRHASSGALWPQPVTATLAVQFGVLLALALGWEVTRGAPKGALQLGLLAAAAAAMGLQGAAMRGLGVTVATTYLTGALTGLIAASTRSSRARADSAAAAALTGAVVGAACGGLLLATVPSAVPLLLLAPVGAVTGAAAYRHRRAVRLSAPSVHPARVDTHDRYAVGAGGAC